MQRIIPPGQTNTPQLFSPDANPNLNPAINRTQTLTLTLTLTQDPDASSHQQDPDASKDILPNTVSPSADQNKQACRQEVQSSQSQLPKPGENKRLNDSRWSWHAVNKIHSKNRQRCPAFMSESAKKAFDKDILTKHQNLRHGLKLPEEENKPLGNGASEYIQLLFKP